MEINFSANQSKLFKSLVVSSLYKIGAPVSQIVNDIYTTEITDEMVNLFSNPNISKFIVKQYKNGPEDGLRKAFEALSKFPLNENQIKIFSHEFIAKAIYDNVITFSELVEIISKHEVTYENILKLSDSSQKKLLNCSIGFDEAFTRVYISKDHNPGIIGKIKGFFSHHQEVKKDSKLDVKEDFMGGKITNSIEPIKFTLYQSELLNTEIIKFLLTKSSPSLIVSIILSSDVTREAIEVFTNPNLSTTILVECHDNPENGLKSVLDSIEKYPLSHTQLKLIENDLFKSSIAKHELSFTKLMVNIHDKNVVSQEFENLKHHIKVDDVKNMSTGDVKSVDHKVLIDNDHANIPNNNLELKVSSVVNSDNTFGHENNAINEPSILHFLHKDTANTNERIHFDNLNAQKIASAPESHKVLVNNSDDLPSELAIEDLSLLTNAELVKSLDNNLIADQLDFTN